MTEEQWLTSEDPQRMLTYVVRSAEPYESRVGPRLASDRKLRLWVEASRGWSKGYYEMTVDPYCNWTEFAVEVARNGNTYFGSNSPTYNPQGLAALLREVVGNPFRHMFREGRTLLLIVCPVCHGSARGKPCPGCNGYQRQLLTLSLHVWLTPAVMEMAQHAYDSRDFSGLPVLADALEEAGCASPRVEARFYVVRQDVGRDSEWLVHHSTPDRPASDSLFTSSMPQTATDWVERHCNVQLWHSPQEMKHAVLCEGVGVLPEHPHPLLAHLRSPGPHVRGCWALDLVLGLG